MALNFKKERLLIIAPHPDDEVIGCAGLISRVKADGGKVYVLFLTVGDTKDFSKKGLSTQNQRLSEIEKVAKFLKYDNYHIAFPGDKYHLQLDKLPQKDLINEIERGKLSLEKAKPTTIIFPSFDDYNQDHRATANAAFAACRPAAADYKLLPKMILSYESTTSSWSLSDKKALNFYVTLTTKNLSAKLHALKLYKSQIRNKLHPRSIEKIKSLAKIRGAIYGVEHAEAYNLYRISF